MEHPLIGQRRGVPFFKNDILFFFRSLRFPSRTCSLDRFVSPETNQKPPAGGPTLPIMIFVRQDVVEQSMYYSLTRSSQ